MKLRQLINEIISEASIEQLQTQFVDTGKISQEVFDSIKEASGGKGAYATWLVKRVEEKKIKEEDIYKFKKYFSIFERNKNQFPEKDINKILDKKGIAAFIKKAVEIASKEEEDPSAAKGVEKGEKYKEFYLGEVDGFKVYEIPQGRKDLYGMSCEIGSGTEWCTATGNTRRHFDSYIEDGPLYIFVKGKEKYQFHYESGSFMDANDESII